MHTYPQYRYRHSYISLLAFYIFLLTLSSSFDTPRHSPLPLLFTFWLRFSPGWYIYLQHIYVHWIQLYTIYIHIYCSDFFRLWIWDKEREPLGFMLTRRTHTTFLLHYITPTGAAFLFIGLREEGLFFLFMDEQLGAGATFLFLRST